MSDTHVRVDATLNEQMKAIASTTSHMSTKDHWNEAAKYYIKNYHEQTLAETIGFERIIRDEIQKLDKHISSFIGKIGMDNSQALVILIQLILAMDEKEVNYVNMLRVLEESRPDAVRFFKHHFKDE